MPRSDRSVSSGRSSRSSKSRGTTVTSKSTDVPLPKRSKVMDFFLWTAGANPRRIMHLRREDITYEDEYDTEWPQHDGRESTYVSRRTRSQLYFVAAPEPDYWVVSDDESTFSRPKSRSSRTHSSGRRHSSHRKSSRSSKRRARAEEESESEGSEYDESDGDYGMPPPPPHPNMYPPPPHMHHPGPPPPPPPPPQGDEMPAFFTINRGG